MYVFNALHVCIVMYCHVMSCHVMSCHVMSCHVMSCHVCILIIICQGIISTIFTHRLRVAGCHVGVEAFQLVEVAKQPGGHHVGPDFPFPAFKLSLVAWRNRQGPLKGANIRHIYIYYIYCLYIYIYSTVYIYIYTVYNSIYIYI